MAKIKTNAHKLSADKQASYGDQVIAKGTGNANVPNNAAFIADFSAKNEALKNSFAAVQAVRLTSKQLTTSHRQTHKEWKASLNILATHTESATAGDPVKIQEAGFDVRDSAKATQPLTAPQGLKVTLNGMEGHSQLDWNTLVGADHFVIEVSPDPITATSWSFLNTATSASYEGNGALAGQKLWYRVAGVNALGRGPWSDPGLRPVM